jgi:Uncharacterized alpha/beta hydrolase domain (DUF2235)
MINGVGLLPKEGANEAEVRAAYDLFEKFAKLPSSSALRDTEWKALMAQFQAFKTEKKSQEVFVEFLGCW